MRTLIALAAVTIASACVSGQAVEVATRPAPTTSADRSLSQSAIAQDLKDPSSAQFRGLRTFALGNGERITCGEVNGKNSFGAYVGFQPFYVRSYKGTVLSKEAGSPAYGFVSQNIVESCAKAAAGKVTVRASAY